ncbi:MAG: hypothetical protein ACJ76Y_30795 [Thermoanaerobaculia bacterium]
MRDLIKWSQQERYPASVLEGICSNYKARLPDRIDLWKRREDVVDHGRFIDAAHSAYLEGNYISSIQTIMPRIEGLMRFLIAKEKPMEKISQESMVENLVKPKNADSLLLPKRLQRYLLDVYFKAFD